MAQMCSALLSMLDTTHTLNEFLGPQLEAVTGGSQVKMDFSSCRTSQMKGVLGGQIRHFQRGKHLVHTCSNALLSMPFMLHAGHQAATVRGG